MPHLTDDITRVPQIGPKSKTHLARLNIQTTEDLLLHYPFRYEDRANVTSIEDLVVGERATIKGKITTVKNIFTRGRKRITTATLEDSTGEVQLVWFNMHYIKKTLRVGETYLAFGTVGTFDKKKTFIVPTIQPEKEKSPHLGRIVPIYPTTEGIKNKWIRTRINDVLTDKTATQELEEFLPQEILEKNHFPEWKEAINQIHFPEDQNTLERARDRLAYEELFIDLINATITEKAWKKQKEALPMDRPEYEEVLQNFLGALPFDLTKDQTQTIEEITKDLKNNIPMNRLLEGDVGTGKTIVAIAAALQATFHGKNVLYMAPTEILAQQHYETFQKFLGNAKNPVLEEINVEIQLITSASRSNQPKGCTVQKQQKKREAQSPNNTEKTQTETTKTIKDTHQKPQIQIGTHALLYKKAKYENLGLVIIDEQHRFGVEQRGKLLDHVKDSETPHLLTMTATPIPRTLALTLYGDLDISILREHPNKQRQIVTKVVPTGKQDAVYKYLSQQNFSTFVVCPFIEESYAENLENVKAATAEYERLKNTFFADKTCALLHGKMTSQEKNEIIEKFKAGDVQVLISTPVIEVGIDVPDADVMVIESAERYGLASLHQLRGRVGRGDKKGYCFVFPSAGAHGAWKRLKHLEQTLDGLKLAEVDLKLRGEGDIYGRMQHGFLRFKLADTNDLEFVKKVRKDVNKIAKNIENYPKLKDCLNRRKGMAARN